MDTRPRYLKLEVQNALARKMVFIGGPRQVGKTTFSLSLIHPNATGQHPAYFNWDNPQIPPQVKKMQLPPGQRVLIFDEIHKYHQWRNLIKGLYDTHKSTHKIIVTGSARLDYYRKGGDSLVNRYRYFRLHPFSLMELSPTPGRDELEALLRFSGFPEPLFLENEKEHRIWRRDRVTRVIREDLRDLEHVREISLIESLVDLLPEKVGNPLSIKSLREDLNVDHKTVVRWLTMLENLYLAFRILPFGGPRIRAVKKETKLYLWDWSLVPNEGGYRLENLVASQLLKYCHWIEDTEGHIMDLRFLRDFDKREVDFVVLKDKKPIFAVECKTGEKAVSPWIKYFAERTKIPYFYQVHLGTKSFETANASVLPFWDFCKKLGMP